MDTIPLSSCEININLRFYKRIYGADRYILPCPTQEYSDISKLLTFADVVYEFRTVGGRTFYKNIITLPYDSSFLRGFYFDSEVENVEIWYGDILLAGWKKLRSIDFKDYLPPMPGITLLWEGDFNISLKYYVPQDSAIALKPRPGKVWMCDLADDIPHYLSIFDENCIVFQKF